MTKTETYTASERLHHILHGFRTMPFRMLPAPYGHTVPIDMREFEAGTEEAQHSERPVPGRSSKVPHEHTRPARQDESLERQ